MRFSPRCVAMTLPILGVLAALAAAVPQPPLPNRPPSGLEREDKADRSRDAEDRQTDQVAVVQRRAGVNVVYDVNRPETPNGVSGALEAALRLEEQYDSVIGLQDTEYDIRVVLRGPAATPALRDAAFDRHSGDGSGNPNVGIVRRLIDRGVSVEVGQATLKRHDWKPTHLIPGVDRVVAAQPRIVDLQKMGYFYMRN